MAYNDSSPGQHPAAGCGTTPLLDRVLTHDGLGRTLLAVTARAVLGDGERDPGELSELLLPVGSGSARPQEQATAAARHALAGEQASELDAGTLAAWFVARYGHRPDWPAKGTGSGRPAGGAAGASRKFPAVVIGSPHGSAAHLAAVLGAPWLPSGFEFALRWPGGSVAEPRQALEHGTAIARRVLATNPDIALRQVHDPVLRGAAAGTTVTLFARWRRVPGAYRDFLSAGLAPGGLVLLVRDARAWPVFDLGGGLGFQLGSPIAGLEPEDYLCAGPDLRQALRLAGADPRRWCPPAAVPVEGFAEHGPEHGFEDDLRAVVEDAGRPVRGVLYPRPAALSAAVAEVVRGWLADSGRADDRLAIECGRLIAPAQALRTGLVPYWCESALRTEITDAEWWLAGSRRFRLIDVLVEPPGRPSSVMAPVAQWRALSWFAGSRGTVDRAGLRAYPYGALSTQHATVVLGGHPDDLPRPPVLCPYRAVDGLADTGRALGLLIY